MSSCTQFCIAIHSLPSTISTALTREVLLEHLPPTNGIRQWHLGTWSEVTQRGDCEVCKLVVAAVNESLQQKEGSKVSPEQPLEVLLLPDEASFRVSYPTPMSARIAFIGSDGSSTHSPDTARSLRHEGIDVARVKCWLQTCDENHSSCTWRDNSAASIIRQDDRMPDAKAIDGSTTLCFKERFNEAATSNFRVIDIEGGYVKPVPLDTKYVALSYVWGQLPMLQLRKDNFKLLTSKGALESIYQQLPRTITDAIDLLKALGLRYLWIDGLCLIQDDADDVALGVSMMNSIYHGSYFTVVAAAGQDADGGLPGLRQGFECSRRKQNVVKLPSGLQLTISHSIDWHLTLSVHNQRGWTLQEIVLPDRTLIFVNEQAYFRCHEANWSEETWADQQTRWLDADDSNISRLPDPLEGFLPSCWAYQKICEDFSRRKLRNDEDALRALQGILRPTAAGMDTYLAEGLPGYYLDHFLLFISGTGDMRRRPQFASYSWAGWEGSKMWPRENYEWPSLSSQGVAISKRDTENILQFFEHNRLVEWYSVGFDAFVEQLTSYDWELQSRVFELMQKHPPVFGECAEDPVRGFRDEACAQFGRLSMSGNMPHWGSRSYVWCGEHVDPGAGFHKRQPLPGFCMSALNLANGQAEFDRLINRTMDGYAKLAMCNWMAVRHIRAKSGPRLKRQDGARTRQLSRRDGLHKDAQLDSSDASPSGNAQDRRISCYNAWRERNAAQTTVPVFPPYNVLSFTTISMHLTLASSPPPPTTINTSPFARIPGTPLLGASGRLNGCLHPDNISLLPSAGSTVEILLVARCHKPTIGSALLDTYFEGGEQPMKLFWGLCVVWQEGIAERRGVGQVLEEALEDAVGQPEVKSVLLG